MRGAARLGILLLLIVAQPSTAFEGDYILDEQFKAGIEKARSGQAIDQYALGNMYLRGRGTRVDHAKALRWFLLAARQGHRKAAYRVGYLYLYGKGVTRSPRRALGRFRQAARAGYAPAQYELGKLFLSGAAGKRDTAKALKWLVKAKAANYAPAEVAFKQMVKRMAKPRKTSPPVFLPESAD